MTKKKDFLRGYYLFKHLSDTALTSLVKGMKRIVCCKGQVIISEDDQVSDHIFLVSSGAFRSTVRVPVVSDEKDIASLFENGRLNISGYKNDLKNEPFQAHPTRYREVEICVHQKNDLFGYQDLLNQDDEKPMNPKVVSLGEGATIIALGKSYMAKHIRTHYKVYVDLINRWNHLVKTRIEATLLGYKAI